MYAFTGSDNLKNVTYLASDPINIKHNILTEIIYPNSYFSAEIFNNALLTMPYALMSEIITREPWCRFKKIAAKDKSSFEYEGLRYEIIDYDARTCQTLSGSESSGGNIITGVAAIPPKVICDVTEFTVTKVGDYGFYGNSKLTSITLPETVASIGYSGFYRCNSLVNIELPQGLTTIKEYSFFECSSLKSIDLPLGLTFIEKHAFEGCSSLESINFPSSLALIGERAFTNCPELYSVRFTPTHETTIGEYVFQNCTSLEEIIFSEGLLSITEGAFEGCSSLSSLTLPNSLKKLGNYAFYRCSSLTTIDLPANLEMIGYNAFGECLGLTNIFYPATNPINGSSSSTVFDGYTSYVAILSMPNALLGDIKKRNPWGMFRNIIAKDNMIPNEVEYDGIQYKILDYGARTCQIVSGSTSVKGDNMELNIPSKSEFGPMEFAVTEIGEYSFSGNERLSTVTIPASVTNIGVGAFRDCPKLSAVVYEGYGKVPADVMNVNDNPNRLLYVNGVANAPTGITNNVVVMNGATSGDCQSLVLEPGYPFMPMGEFTAAKATLMKGFRQQTPVGSNAGWETLVLPFEVSSITYEGRDMKPLSSSGATPQNPFWLYEADKEGMWKEASRIRAGVPYIIAMPNSPDYDPAYNVDGTVTFSATGARISRATTAPYAVTWSNSREFRSLWMPLEESEAANAMGLNAGITGLTDDSGKVLEPGSAFCADVTPKPFEGYVTRLNGAERAMRISGGGESGLALPTISDDLSVVNTGDGLTLCSMRDRKVEVLRPDGVCVANVYLRAGEKYCIHALPKGIYIVAGLKIAH